MAGDQLSEAERAFLARFRLHMSRFGWLPELAPDDWYSEMDLIDAVGRCLAWADVIHGNHVERVVGAYFSTESTTVGELHNQLFTMDHASPLTRQLKGSLDERASATAHWFAELKERWPTRSFSGTTVDKEGEGD